MRYPEVENHMLGLRSRRWKKPEAWIIVELPYLPGTACLWTAIFERGINIRLTKATVNLDFLLYIAEPIQSDIRVYITQSYPFRQGLKYNEKARENTKDLWLDYIFRGYILGSGKHC